jgi:hypothetical protein
VVRARLNSFCPQFLRSLFFQKNKTKKSAKPCRILPRQTHLCLPGGFVQRFNVPPLVHLLQAVLEHFISESDSSVRADLEKPLVLFFVLVAAIRPRHSINSLPEWCTVHVSVSLNYLCRVRVVRVTHRPPTQRSFAGTSCADLIMYFYFTWSLSPAFADGGVQADRFRRALDDG